MKRLSILLSMVLFGMTSFACGVRTEMVTPNSTVITTTTITITSSPQTTHTTTVTLNA